MSENKKPKLFLGNNITAKAKSATFWTGMIPVLATFIVSILSLLGVPVAEDIVNQYTAIATTIISILTGLGVLVSHDTKGIADSDIVKNDFTKPRDSKDPEQALQWENVSNPSANFIDNTKDPKVYTKDEDFSDVNEHLYDDEEEPYKDTSKPYGVNWDEEVDTTKNVDNKKEVNVNENNESSSVLYTK